MKNKTAISIVIPVYNTAPWLKECLDSVVNQTFEDIEIICINDASTDNSAQILNLYAQNDERIHIVSIDHNKGQSYARNVGIDIAIGEYIYFLDSDDYIFQNAIEEMYKKSKTNKLDILYFDSEPVFENDKYRENFSSYLFHRNEENYHSKVYPGKELLGLFLKNDEWTCSMPRHFFRREFLKAFNIRFQEGRIHEDELFAFKCAIYAERVEFDPHRYFFRRFRNNSTMTSCDPIKSFVGYFSAAWYMNKFAHEKKVYDTPIIKYIARINNRCIALFEKTRNSVVHELSTLNDLELLNAFYYFESQNDLYYAYGFFSTNLIRKLGKYRDIYIYGAGIIAKSVYQGIIKINFAVKGFLVSNARNNPSVLYGHYVFEFNDHFSQIASENCVVVIALKKGADEIANMLDSMGIVSIVYNE